MGGYSEAYIGPISVLKTFVLCFPYKYLLQIVLRVVCLYTRINEVLYKVNGAIDISPPSLSPPSPPPSFPPSILSSPVLLGITDAYIFKNPHIFFPLFLTVKLRMKEFCAFPLPHESLLLQCRRLVSSSEIVGVGISVG